MIDKIRLDITYLDENNKRIQKNAGVISIEGCSCGIKYLDMLYKKAREQVVEDLDNEHNK